MRASHAIRPSAAVTDRNTAFDTDETATSRSGHDVSMSFGAPWPKTRISGEAVAVGSARIIHISLLTREHAQVIGSSANTQGLS